MIDIQKISNLNSLPENDSIIKWAKKALDKKYKGSEIVIRIVDENESRELNKIWCKKIMQQMFYLSLSLNLLNRYQTFWVML